MADYFSPQLSTLESGTPVTVTGYVHAIRKFTEHFAIHLKDPFGTILVTAARHITNSDSEPAAPARKSDRIRVHGVVAYNSDARPVVVTAEPPILLGSATAKLSELDVAMREQASKVLLAQATRLMAAQLRADSFVEFDTRTISTRWSDEGLEPMRVVYPGFGCPLPLATSPAAQVVDFMNTTGATRAFTCATSFSTTYRFPDAGTELRVVVGKAAGISPAKLVALLRRVIRQTLERVDGQTYGPDSWLGDGTHRSVAIDLRTVDLSSVEADGRSSTRRTSVTQILSPNGAPLAEGYREPLGDAAVLGGFTFYPSNLLPLLSATPARNLEDLRRLRVW